MNDELFNIALNHCGTISDDLDAQSEKLRGVHDKLVEHSEHMIYNEKWIKKLQSSANLKNTYRMIGGVVIFFGTVFAFIKLSK